MLTLDNTGIKLFALASMKEHCLYLLLFFCLCCVVPLSMQYRLQLVNSSYESTAKWENCHIFKEDRLLVHI